MSKNLEREYRALVNSEAPNLWARIEAGLEDKETAPKKTETDLHVTHSQGTDSQVESVYDKKIHFKVWAGVAAACVCVALIVPAMTRTMKMSGGSSSSNASPNYTAQNTTPQTLQESYAETRQEAAEYEGSGNGAADENGMSNSAVTSDSIHTAAESNTDSVNFASGGLQEAAEEKQELYGFQVTVEILAADVRINSGIVYLAKVIASENPEVQVDSEINIFSEAVSVESMTTLETSQTYDLILCEEHSGQERAYILVNDVSE